MKEIQPSSLVATNIWERMAAGWNRFWFRPADPTMLGLIRICTGLVILYVHWVYSYQLEAFVGANAWLDLPTANALRTETPWVPPPSDWGDLQPINYPDNPTELRKIQEFEKKWNTDPRQAVELGNYAWSLWFHVTDPTEIRIIHRCILVIMVLFTLGFCTRITSVLTWLAALSYIQRSSNALFGMDTMMNILLLYLMIGPSGAALSVDRLIARYWTTWRSLRNRQPAPVWADPVPLVSANFVVRLMQIHFCFIYLMAGLAKLQGAAWWNGTALWQVVANYEFHRPQAQLYTDVLRFLVSNRFLWEIVMGGSALFTLVLEIGLPFLVWNRYTRWPMITAAVMLHAGISLFTGLPTFSLLMLFLVFSFIPGELVRRWLNWLSRGPSGLSLILDSRNRWQVRIASAVHALDPHNRVALLEVAAARQSGVVPEGVTPARLELLTPEGEILTGYGLFERLTRALRLLWPLALWTWIPGANRLGRALAPEDSQPPSPPPGEPPDRRVPGDANITSAKHLQVRA